jgi:hypothetical protein
MQRPLSLLVVLALFSACAMSDPKTNLSSKNEDDKVDAQPSKVQYVRFEPPQLADYELRGYDIQDAFVLDSLIVLEAYSDGDLESSEAPTNWGDRLLVMKNDYIFFESTPVGDPYQYQPFFYSNNTNSKIVIICQLGNEFNYGGEAFLLDNGKMEFMGQIKIESPYETPDNTNLIEIIRISEIEDILYFHFEADSLIDLTNDWNTVKNDNIYYVFQEHTFVLRGL